MICCDVKTVEKVSGTGPVNRGFLFPDVHCPLYLNSVTVVSPEPLTDICVWFGREYYVKATAPPDFTIDTQGLVVNCDNNVPANINGNAIYALYSDSLGWRVPVDTQRRKQWHWQLVIGFSVPATAAWTMQYMWTQRRGGDDNG